MQRQMRCSAWLSAAAAVAAIDRLSIFSLHCETTFIVALDCQVLFKRCFLAKQPMATFNYAAFFSLFLASSKRKQSTSIAL